ncbi:MAG: Asp-tRNA(Asn)/Glu-tRNA(Gln) amidotransferase GatCAB subunit B [Candidatus Latescibacterota bacterium]|nr:MAG: Asp-tRNA(Asn)/Glu-tRNA(Gln) amidotransferase GatCAB subunit B [Candidatus Latescibacterota bacterium]
MEYETMIGLEIHAQLSTKSKIFCGCSTEFGDQPNTHGCPICLGMPGVLPVLNHKAVEYALKLALAVGSEIQPRSRFLRKNYFYPDLPKGYQISQYQSESEPPLATGGSIEIEVDSHTKRIRLRRIHMEEDAGKLVHEEEYVPEGQSLFDVNRCGVPLIEIVTEPDINSPEEAYQFLSKLKQILVYLGICEGNMEKGNIRIDTNISVRPKGAPQLGTRTEIKNMNSLHNLQRALETEIKRQVGLLERGGKVIQQTMTWDAKREIIAPMRSKEESHDYRYFPEPDLVPIEVDKQWLEKLKADMPELPTARRRRFVQQYNLPEYDAEVLTASRGLADYYEECVKSGASPKMASNWVMGEVNRVLNEKKITPQELSVTPESLAELLQLVSNGTLSTKIARDVFAEMVQTGRRAGKIVKEKGLVQLTDRGKLGEVIDEVLAENPDQREQYLAGKKQLLGFFVGQVMKKTQGKANPKLANQILQDRLRG